jgi:hypothetical protein
VGGSDPKSDVKQIDALLNEQFQLVATFFARLRVFPYRFACVLVLLV